MCRWGDRTVLEEVDSPSADAVKTGRWEYHVIVDRGRMGVVKVEDLDALGTEGWELLTIVPGARENETNYFFKRPKA